MAPKAKARAAKTGPREASVKKARSKKAAPKATPAKLGPEDLRRRVQIEAYYLWVKRGHKHGADRADWIEAERRVKSSLGF